MTLPGFGAEASIYKVKGHYRTISIGPPSANQHRIVPQLMRWRIITTVLEDGTICVGIEDEDSGISVPLGCY